MTHATSGHAALMDATYRFQRHIYDATRKNYLLGRDRLIDGLAVPPGGSVLEIGCGTGRNLSRVARRYPDARLHGLDISEAMLATARSNLARAGVGDRIVLAQGDATAFDADALFGVSQFDRVFFSYALSMIPAWRQAIAKALVALKPEGSLHIVDFGRQERLPALARLGLRAWLGRFHVNPRDGLRAELQMQAARNARASDFRPLYRGYACIAVIGPSFRVTGAPED
jgi:S-adenosylmethionine-diacylgycerolhomoserine-N-methlytransferase